MSEPSALPAPVASWAAVEDLADLSGPLRRYVASLVRDEHDVDDIVQETLIRMWQVTQRLEIETLSAYAFTVARNLVLNRARSETTARRHLPKLLDLNEPVRPDESAVTAEARHALAAALASLAPERREALLARDIHRRPLAEVAEQQNATPTSSPRSCIAPGRCSVSTTSWPCAGSPFPRRPVDPSSSRSPPATAVNRACSGPETTSPAVAPVPNWPHR